MLRGGLGSTVVVVSAGASVVVAAGAAAVCAGAAVVFVVPLAAAPSLPQAPSRMLTPSATTPAVLRRWFDCVVRAMLTGCSFGGCFWVLRPSNDTAVTLASAWGY
jgi:hypothetical protein